MKVQLNRLLSLLQHIGPTKLNLKITIMRTISGVFRNLGLPRSQNPANCDLVDDHVKSVVPERSHDIQTEGNKNAGFGFEFESGAKNAPQTKHQSESPNKKKTKTKSADEAAIYRKIQKHPNCGMDKFGRYQKIIKELLYFYLEDEEFDFQGDMEAKTELIFASISEINIGRDGYNVKKTDVVRARQVHIWPEPFPHGPIVIEFVDNVVNLVKNALEKAGNKIDFKFGAFLCEISCQNSVGNRWPRLRHKLMERLRDKPTETSARIWEIRRGATADRTADLPFPQIKIERQTVKMSSERRRLARANSSNPRALRVIEINEDDNDMPIQAPAVTSSSSTMPPARPRRQRFTAAARDARRVTLGGTRSRHLENIARSRSQALTREADSTSSSDSSVTFVSSFMSDGMAGASTSTPNNTPQAGQNVPNVVVDLTVSSDEPTNVSDYHTAPETQGEQVSNNQNNVHVSQFDHIAQAAEPVGEVDDDDDIPSLSDIEAEMSREAEDSRAVMAAADAAIAAAKQAIQAASSLRWGGAPVSNAGAATAEPGATAGAGLFATEDNAGAAAVEAGAAAAEPGATAGAGLVATEDNSGAAAVEAGAAAAEPGATAGAGQAAATTVAGAGIRGTRRRHYANIKRSRTRAGAAVDGYGAAAATYGAGAAQEDVQEDVQEGAATSEGDTDYLASVSPSKIPKVPKISLPLVLENDVITIGDSSSSSSSSSESGSEGWVNRTPSSTSTDDERHLEISRQELRDVVGISDEEDGNVPGPNGPTRPGMSRPDRNDRNDQNDRRVNFLLLQSTVVIDDGIVETVDEKELRENRIAYHQRTLAKELLITLLERMAHIDNDLFDIFSDPKNRRSAGNRTAFGLAGDENWPRGLTMSELLVGYENGYDWVRKQEDAEAIIEYYHLYHPSVFHTTGTRRVYVGPCYNRTPPLGTPMDTFNTFRELQPIPARSRPSLRIPVSSPSSAPVSSPSIVIPFSPVYVPETPEPRQHFRFQPEQVSPPEINAIPADVSLQFEENCGFLNKDLETAQAATADWAHAILDAEEAMNIPAHLLPANPFINPREPKIPVTYRRSIRNLFVRLVLRLDSINEAKFARTDLPTGNAPWYNEDPRRAKLMEALNNYDEVVLEVERIKDQMEVAKASKVAEAESIVLDGLEDLHLTTEAAKAEAGKIKTENLKPVRRIRHYFTRCESGAVVVNYEYVGFQDALFTPGELRDFERLTRNGACTAQDCECPGNPASSYDQQISGADRLANLSGRTLSQFVPSREPRMINGRTYRRAVATDNAQTGFRPLRQIRPTPMRPVAITSPVTPDPEVPRSEVRRSATYIVQPAGMSDDDSEDDVFDMLPLDPTPTRNPRPNEEHWYNCDIDSE